MVCSAGSSAALPYRGVRPVQLDTDSHLGFQRESRQSRGSWVVVVGAAAAVVRGLGLGAGSAAVRVAAHIAVSREVVGTVVSRVVARIVDVCLRRRQVEEGSVAVGVREGMRVVVGRTGRLEEARSTDAVPVGLVHVKGCLYPRVKVWRVNKSKGH